MKEREFIKRALSEKLGDSESIRREAVSSGRVRPEPISRGKLWKRLSAIGMMSVVVVLALSLTVFYTPGDSNNGNPQNASAYAALLEVIENYHEKAEAISVDSLNGLKEYAVDDAQMSPEADSTDSEGGSYSKTNVQTEGVDEGDIVKTDGQYIYKLSTTGCYIIGANHGDMTVVSSISVENYVPQELYIRGNKLVMVGGIYTYMSYTGTADIEPMYDCFCYISYQETDIRVYDISVKSAPVLERRVTLDGYLYTTRILEETNELIYMVNYYFSYGEEDGYIPEVADTEWNGGEKQDMPVENIYYYEDIVNYSYLIIGKIDLDTPEAEPVVSAFLGLSGTIYVSNDNIYVATFDWYSRYTVNLWGWVSYDYSAIPESRLVRISIADLTQKASGKIQGYVNDRYWMDEYDGHLRVASQANWFNSYSMVTVLDLSLNVTGKIDNIAPGESIYSVRFNGETGTLVTFEQVDPYFKLDLSDPANPTISAGLKEDGVSYYIHYIGDTVYTIGVGRNTEVVHEYWGDRVVWKELKVSLYDNSGEEAVNIATVVIPVSGDYVSCYSELFYDPKALLYDEETGLFAFPYESWSYNNNYSYSSMSQGLAVFSFDLTAADDADKLVYNGTFSNTGASMSFSNYYDYYDYYDAYRSFINRGVMIDGYIYTVSDKYITSYNMDTMVLEERLLLDDIA